VTVLLLLAGGVHGVGSTITKVCDVSREGVVNVLDEVLVEELEMLFEEVDRIFEAELEVFFKVVEVEAFLVEVFLAEVDTILPSTQLHNLTSSFAEYLVKGEVVLG